MRFAWRAALGLAATAALSGCAVILGIDDGTPRDGAIVDDGGGGGPDSKAVDAGGKDATPLKVCDTNIAFSTPALFATLSTNTQDAHLRLVPGTELIGYLQSSRTGGLGSVDIYTATRSSIGDTWSVVPVAGVNTTTADDDPSVSADQLTLYWAHASTLWRATRATTASSFGSPVAITAIYGGQSDFSPYLTDDGAALYFSTTRDSDAGVSELFVTQPQPGGKFTVPVPVNGTNLNNGDNRAAAVTADQLVMYFASTRSGGQGNHDIWVATRSSTSLPFGDPRVVTEVSSAADDQADWVSADRCRLYITSNRGGTYEVYVATKTLP